jgi:hypothetical protein
MDWGQVITVAEKQAAHAEAEYNSWKASRDAAVAALTVDVGGITLSADEASQNRASRAITVAFLLSIPDTQAGEWNAADGTVISITLGQLKEYLEEAFFAQAAIWNDGNPL